MVYQKLTVCNCKGTNKGGSRLSGHVAHATPDRRLRRTRIFKFADILGTTVEYLICGVIKTPELDADSVELMGSH